MLNTGRDVQINGFGYGLPKDYTLSRWELRLTRKFKEWVIEHITNPLDIGADTLNSLPQEEQNERRKQAEDIRRDLLCFSLTSPLAKHFLGTEEGIAAFMQIWLSKHHPEVTEEEAFDVAMAVMQDMDKLMGQAQGKLPGGNAQPPA